MTEEEAKTKWCPFARLSPGDGTYNRSEQENHMNCIASECMAWRWNDVYRGTEKVGKQKDKGHCGLAGAP